MEELHAFILFVRDGAGVWLWFYDLCRIIWDSRDFPMCVLVYMLRNVTGQGRYEHYVKWH